MEQVWSADLLSRAIRIPGMVDAALASAFHHLPSDFWYSKFGKATDSPTVAESKMA